jgi:hypothetical protein
MRNKISISGLSLNTDESKELLSLLQASDEVEHLELKTGLEYHADIELYERDSEMAFSDFSFYFDGNAESATVVINNVVNLINITHPFPKGRLCVTMTDCKSTHFFF